MGLRYTSTASTMTIDDKNNRTRLKVGVIGLGRLGKVYVRDLAARIPETTVVAVADIDRALADKHRRGIRRAEGLWFR